MKSYQLYIEILHLDTPVWRRVIMPADATFKRLHDTIQNSLNFESGYPADAYHLYAFHIPEEDLQVTNDTIAQEENKALKKRFKKAPSQEEDPYGFIALQLKKTLRQPQTIKIDRFIEEYGEILYMYDFGDDWRIRVTLEKIVEDHYYGYPILLDGEGTAPPEEVGGVPGFAHFLEVYDNADHPDHKDIKAWLSERRFKEYDPEWINGMLKGIHYKKTEWDKMNQTKGE